MIVDLGLYMRVITRFRFLVAGGLILAVCLAFLAAANVSFAGGKPSLAYRQKPLYSAQTTLFVTQPGFPWGRTTPQYKPTNPATGEPAVPLADPTRLATLTTIYAALATSDTVHRQLRRQGAPDGTIAVTAVPAPAYSSPAILPLLTLSSTTQSPRGAIVLANLASEAFQGWLIQQQVKAGIPQAGRVDVQIVHRANKVAILSGRSKTLPVLVFLTVLAATMGLIFVLENMRPSARAVPDQRVSAAPERRTA